MAKFQETDLPGGCCSHFRKRGHEKLVILAFYFCLKWLKFLGKVGYNLGSGNNCWPQKFDFISIDPVFGD